MQQIVALAAVEDIGPLSACELIVVAIAEQRIVAAGSIDDVDAVPALDRFAGCARDICLWHHCLQLRCRPQRAVSELHALDSVPARIAEPALDLDLIGRAHAERQIVSGAHQRDARRRDPRAEAQRVGIGGVTDLGDRVLAVAEVEQVSRRSARADDRVIARAALDRARAVDRVVARATAQLVRTPQVFEQIDAGPAF